MDATEARLVTAIEDDPRDVENFRVYADWLDGNGDPRGRLITMMIMLERITDGGKREHLLGKLAAHFHQHRESFLPPLWRGIDATSLFRYAADGMQWRYGFARHLTVYGYSESTDRLAELLVHPSGRFLVELGATIGSETHSLTELLLERRPRALRSLVLLLNAPYDMSSLWPALARLETLALRGGLHPVQLGDVALPALRHLGLEGELPSFAPLLAAPYPDLEQVDLDIQQLRIADVRPLLVRTDLPKLTALGLRRNPFTDDLCRELPESPLGSRLQYLDLQGGMMTDAGARTFADGMARLKRPPLEKITVTGNRLTREGRAALARVAKTVVDES
jgi:uncharacterized protein (TIGR02996 family)